MTRRALVTGCSSGFGRATALALTDRGWCVFATVRKREDALDLRHVAAARGAKLVVLDRFDVTDLDIVERVQRLSPLDAVVNNAGYSLWGPLEVVSIDEVRQQFEVNVFGMLRVTRAALPDMRARGNGHVVNIGSTVTPKLGAAPYAASKAALKALTEVLAIEVAPFGIRVSLIEPGMYATRYARNRVVSLGDVGAQYLDAHDASAPTHERLGAGDPADVAQLIAGILEDMRPSGLYVEEDA